MSDDYIEKKSDEELLKMINPRFAYTDAERIKAQAILRAREQADAQRKHDETISVSRSANKLSKWAIFIASLSLIVAVIALYKPNRDSTNEPEKLKIESHTQPQVFSHPSNTMNATQHQVKSRPTSTRK